MSISIYPSEQDWIKQFFSGRNQLRWEQIEKQEATTKALSQLVPWLKKVADGPLSEPIVLPMYEPDGQVTWYGMAPDAQSFSQFIDEINGFIGPTYSNFCGESASLNLDDPSESAAAARFDSRVITFSANEATDQQNIENALRLYLSVCSRRPAIKDRTQRPFGRIRTDFDRALLAGDSGRATALLEELLASGRINAEQRKCLEIRLLAGLGRTEELAKNQALISSVSDLSLPVQTLVDITAALYDTFIVPIEKEAQLKEVLELFKRRILAPYASLFRERKGIRKPNVLRAFLLSELAQNEPSATRWQSILAAYPETGEGFEIAAAWCKAVEPKKPSTPVVSEDLTLSQAKQAIGDEDYETAYALALGLIPNQWAYSAILRCAIELESEDIRKKVLDLFQEASVEIKSHLSGKDQSRLESLKDPPETRLVIKGWTNWAQLVSKSPNAAPSVTELQDMSAKWCVEDYATDTKRCDELANIIGGADKEAEGIFRDAFPVLVDFFTDELRSADRAFKSLYATLLKVLGWSGQLSSDELEIGFQLLRSFLSVGPDKEEYKESLEDMREILGANAAPAYIDWSLNTAEMLAFYPAPDGGDGRLRMFMEIVGALQAMSHRMTAAQREILEILSLDYGCPSLLENFPAEESAAATAPQSVVSYDGLIGIYTLTEGAGQRAKEILQKKFQKARIEINGDHASTDRLAALAKNADIFVFAWKSSKHQAYFCVKDARQGRDIVLPLGKGTASIVSGVLDKISDVLH